MWNYHEIQDRKKSLEINFFRKKYYLFSLYDESLLW